VKRFLTAPVAALAVLLLGTFAHASNLPPNQIAWSYNWAPSAPAVLATGNPSAGVTFTNEPDKVAVGSSDVVASNLRVFSAATAALPDVITSTGNYTLSLKLSANDGGNVFTQTLTFSGTWPVRSRPKARTSRTCSPTPAPRRPCSARSSSPCR